MPSIIPDRQLVLGRFAPSPTGPLHLGSLTAALGSWLHARHAQGQWLVRIEDLDPPREQAGIASDQLRTLTGFGLVSDLPVACQSERHAHYRLALEQLLDAGLAFECRCSRSDLAATGGVHRSCVANPSGQRAAVRLRVADARVQFMDQVRGSISQDVGREVGDFVLLRADGHWAYQLAVVVDDALQGVTEVVRGADLLDSTPRQIVLQRALGLPTPRYAHLPLLRTADGTKLGKSVGSLAVDPARWSAPLGAVYAWLGQDRRALEGCKTPADALACALAAFDPAAIPACDHVLRVA